MKKSELKKLIQEAYKEVKNEKQQLNEGCISPCSSNLEGLDCTEWARNRYAGFTDGSECTVVSMLDFGCVVCACYCHGGPQGPGFVVPGGPPTPQDLEGPAVGIDRGPKFDKPIAKDR